MPEAIRLVIWDLDGTFWSGTVAEGGHVYNQAHHDIVIALAQRGIMSAICSKNDFGTVQKILQEAGIWDYFIFPSINWEPKGPRLKNLVEDVQLRPASVLFIDDNHLNRQEALHFVPEMQVWDETRIPNLLTSPLCAGKPDLALTRLHQYKLLQRRQSEVRQAGGDNKNFLRASGITVTIDSDVEGNIDRAIELINRTNQLNFTKTRLPENQEEARAELRALINRYNIQAGLVRVQDHYGDYGVCGFFAIRSAAVNTRLLHFCFSCRVLNMGVELWLYRRLGTPAITIAGEVVSDLFSPAPTPDWINGVQAAQSAIIGLPPHIKQVIAHGGCDIQNLTHYFRVSGAEVIGEFNLARHNTEMFRNHSMFLRYAAQGVSATEQAELEALGYLPEDWQTALLAPPRPNPVWLLSFWADMDVMLYRHKSLGLKVPFALAMPAGLTDLTKMRPDQLPPGLQTPWARQALHRLAADYEFAGHISKEEFTANVRLVLDRAAPDAKIFVMLINEYKQDETGTARHIPSRAFGNSIMREVIAGYPNATALNVRDFVRSKNEVDPRNPNHFERLVYYRLYQHIVEMLQGEESTAFCEQKAAKKL